VTQMPDGTVGSGQTRRTRGHLGRGRRI
jgi:hypothetical protein